ncbi:MAG: hypothetical protein GX221_09240 [Candidatus Riflebacteria bacterium]|nr:hypothetical protein [Candidatus Riflebacteria bacterium]
MASKYNYLMSYLPPLPCADNIFPKWDELKALLLQEDSTVISHIIEILDSKDKIDSWLDQKYNEFAMPSFLESDVKDKTSDSEPGKELAKQATTLYAGWLKRIVDSERKIGSKLLSKWAAWVYYLKLAFWKKRIENLEHEDLLADEAPEITLAGAMPKLFKVIQSSDEGGFDALINHYYSIKTPIEAERMLDKAQIDFIDTLYAPYSASIDELTAYLLKYKIYERQKTFNLEAGQRILKEVMAL